jgi:putative membrane protein
MPENAQQRSRFGLTGLLIVAAVATAWSAWRPYDYGTWAFELALGFAGLAVLAATRRRFHMSGLAYALAAVHFVILAAGAKYTYAEMPLFNWLRDALGLARNHFDRVGHFMQGFVPAILAREVLLRTSPLRPGKWLSFLCVAVPLAFSAFYELLEWWMVALFYPSHGPYWLGMQGDPWDAQWDMLMALAGATLAIALLSRLHDRSMRRIVT